MEFSLLSHRLDFGRNSHILSVISNFASFPLQTTHIDCQPWYSPKQNTTTTHMATKRSSRSLLCAKNLLCKVLAGRQGRALVVIINSTTLTYQTCSKHAVEERKSLFLHEGRNNEHHLWSFFFSFVDIYTFYSPGQGGWDHNDVHLAGVWNSVFFCYVAQLFTHWWYLMMRSFMFFATFDIF